ncbi:Lipid droplet phospholipase 1 [Pseudozyma hubeiensis]|nr:Lipid droplet phospholipase 1 [Pseudozyma hubeiensis]
MPSAPVHLVVIHHGLWGSPSNTSFLATTLAKFHGGLVSPSSPLTPPESASTISALASDHPNATRTDIRMVVLNSEVNSGDHTYDGVDWCGERLVKDIYAEVERIEKEDEDGRVGRISLIGYSLGGLVIRYAAGVMYADGFFGSGEGEKRQKTNGVQGGKVLSFKSRPVPASMSTIATPHLGVTLTGSMFSKVAASVGSSNLGRSGKQLYLADRGWVPPPAASSTNSTEETLTPDESDADSGLCLVEALSDPRFNFITAMRLFSRIDIYANAVSDLTVSYRTAAFEPHDPFLLLDQIQLVRDATHPPLLASFTISSTPKKDERSFWSKIGAKLSTKNLPWMLNPQRFPFKFPLNYLALVALPVLLPVMLGLVVHKLRSDSKVSNRRVEEFERVWAMENGLLTREAEGREEEDDSLKKVNGKKISTKKMSKSLKLDKAVRGELERKRVSNFLSAVEAEAEETLREVGEDYIQTTPNSSSSSPPIDNARYTPKPNTPTHFPTLDNFTPSKDEHPLLPTQLRIISNLNNSSLLPHVKKHLVHFEDVLNSHAVIIVRTPTMDAHKKGIEFIQAFVARFGL